MKKCLVVGGGLAGLSAAVSLTKQNIHVQLLEASPKFGGRTYSFLDEKSGNVIDNGQHLLLGCYYETIEFIKLIRATDSFHFQKQLEINVVAINKINYQLKATELPYPLGLLFGLLNYDVLSILDKIKIILLITQLPFLQSEKYLNLSVEDWLQEQNQSRNCIKSFWEIIAVGALNSQLKDASAKIFIDILKVIFLKGSDASAMIIPKVGLSKAFIDPAISLLQRNNSELVLSEKLLEVSVTDKKAISVITDKGTINNFDAVILAIPSYALNKINANNLIIENGKTDLSTSSIVTLHLWLKQNKLKKPFYAFIDSPLHWVFNHGAYITTVTSSADEMIEKTQEELLSVVSAELHAYLGITTEDISSYKVIKEKRATFIPNKENLENRPSAKTKVENVFLAGDWTDTGLPATIEGAIKSGNTAALEVKKYFSSF
ncbi:MAG: hydroxysqualene dehydroxylase HpnE [Ignavibacteriaceae bacterium]|jgi:squalene-associated FAD-dependent desaturase